MSAIHASLDHGTSWELAWRIVVWIFAGFALIELARDIVPAFLEGWHEPRRQPVGSGASKP